MLLATDWRPDCTVANGIFVERLVPPATERGRSILFGPPGANTWLGDVETYELGECPPGEHTAIRVETMSRIYKGVGLTLAYVRLPDGTVRIETRIWGRRKSKGYPKFVSEAAVLQALEIAKLIKSTFSLFSF